ncbi:carbamoyltransferase family protein [Rhodococcus sp. NBC_00297]|uniref:carbamoyltransferase family protein n=1 Tax=Rhodococcus sp. NBC_00297 TaxID=2976005 RepID=UPI002E2DD5BC|nr:carbamoyltransferase C-terminal domain-containing protein [Rhodococcus sp. NBC_00297]
MRVLGINAVFHDSAAVVMVDGRTVAAAEEERFSRRKHGKRPVPFSAWELPEAAIRWCLDHAGLDASDIDAVAYSYDPALVDHDAVHGDRHGGLDPRWEELRTTYAERAPHFLSTVLGGAPVGSFHHVRHHVAHAASAGLLAPFGGSCAVLVSDGRGESTSMLSGRYIDSKLEVHATQSLPHSLGLLYEDLTEHLGFARSSDEYKVMALASYGRPRHLPLLRRFVHVTDDGGFRTEWIDWEQLVPRRAPDARFDERDADLACSVQAVVEEVLLALTRELADRTGEHRLAMAGGTALNCVANTRVLAEGPFDDIWVQPAAGDSGTAWGAAATVAAEAGDTIAPMTTAALGRRWSDDEIAAQLTVAKVPFERPVDLASAAAEVLADNGIVAWFQGPSEFGPRALGHRSLLAHPGHAGNVERLNDVKGREQFRPVAPMVLAHRAPELFSRGPIPSPYMLFVHDVDPAWRDRLPAVTHVDGTARIQTVEDGSGPTAAMLREFDRRTGIPVVVNTSLNTAGRPMVDSPHDALELFGSSPVDALAIGPFLVRRSR